MNKKKIITAASAVALAAVLLFGGTMAYLYNESEEVTNTISPNYNSVSLSETGSDGNTTQSNTYDIVPGTSDTKDPVATATYTLDSYVYIVMDETASALVDFSIDTSVWTQLDGYTNVWYTLVTEDNADSSAPASGNENVTVHTKALNVLTDKTISYKSTLTNDDMTDDEGNLISDVTIEFQAYIVQATLSDDDSYDSSGHSNPVAAYPVARGASTYDASGETVFAEITDTDGDGEITAADVAAAIEAAENTPTAFVLNSDITVENAENAITVAEGQTISLTLADGVTIQSTVQGVAAISNSGTLEVSGGTVDATQHATAAITNNKGATMVLSGVTVTRSGEAGSSTTSSGGNSYYYLVNQGDMTLTDCTIESSGKFSSLIRNGGDTNTSATLTIESGTYSGGVNTVKNDENGILVINGGKFTNSTQYAVMNWNVAAINGGTFESTAMSAISNECDPSGESTKGVLNIYGGTFTSADGCTGIGSKYGGTGSYTYGTIGVYGGTWNTNSILPTNFSGSSNDFVVTDNGNGTYTVSPQSVSTADGLSSALANTPENGVIEVSGTISLDNVTTEIPDGTTLAGSGTSATVLTVDCEDNNGDGYTISSENVTLSDLTISCSNMGTSYGNSAINVTASGVTLDNVVITGGTRATYTAAVYINGQSDPNFTFTIKNSTINASSQAPFRALFVENLAGTLYVENCTLDAVYPMNIMSAATTAEVYFTNCTIHGWTSYTGNVNQVTFTNCTFSKGSGANTYDNVAAYTDTVFDNCTFDDSFVLYAQTTGFSWTLNNCTKNGTAVTADNFKTLFTADADVWNKCTCTVDGVEVAAD